MKSKLVVVKIVFNKLVQIIKNPLFMVFYVKYYTKRGVMLLCKKSNGYVVSYPKSGRSWLERLIDDAMSSPEKAHLIYTHAGSSWATRMLDESSISNFSQKPFEKSRTLFLYRHPLDTLVSSYYQTKFRLGYSELTKDELINSPVFGIKKIIAFMNYWHQFSVDHPEVALMLSYEELRSDTVNALQKIFHFFKFDCKQENIEKSVEKNSFKNMQQREKNATSKALKTSPYHTGTDPNNPNTFKARKGAVGEHKEFFSEQELKGLYKIIESKLHPYFKSYLDR